MKHVAYRVWHLTAISMHTFAIATHHGCADNTNVISPKDVQDAKVAYPCCLQTRSHVDHPSLASGYAQAPSLLQLPSNFLGLPR